MERINQENFLVATLNNQLFFPISSMPIVKGSQFWLDDMIRYDHGKYISIKTAVLKSAWATMSRCIMWKLFATSRSTYSFSLLLLSCAIIQLIGQGINSLRKYFRFICQEKVGVWCLQEIYLWIISRPFYEKYCLILNKI